MEVPAPARNESTAADAWAAQSMSFCCHPPGKARRSLDQIHRRCHTQRPPAWCRDAVRAARARRSRSSRVWHTQTAGDDRLIEELRRSRVSKRFDGPADGVQRSVGGSSSRSRLGSSALRHVTGPARSPK